MQLNQILYSVESQKWLMIVKKKKLFFLGFTKADVQGIFLMLTINLIFYFGWFPG